MHLAPLLTTENLEVLQEAERRLGKPEAVSTVSAPGLSNKKQNQGNRKSKQSTYNKYFYN